MGRAWSLLCVGLLAASASSMWVPGRRMEEDAETGASLRAGELKKRLGAAGVSTHGIVDKEDLVQLYDALSAEEKSAAIAKVSAPVDDAPPASSGDKAADIADVLEQLKNMPGMEGLRMFNADDLANMDPSKMADMFGKGMGGMGTPPPSGGDDAKTVEQPPEPKEIKSDDAECRRRRRSLRELTPASSPRRSRRALGWTELRSVVSDAAHSFGIPWPRAKRYDAHVQMYEQYLETHQRDAHAEVYLSQQGWGGVQREWLNEFSERMACWWEATPFQANVQACTADVEDQMGTRLQIAQGHTAAPKRTPDDGCEWVPTLFDRLEVPSFPDLGDLPSLDFSLPRELLPWSLRKWQEAGEVHSALPATYDWTSFGMGAGGAIGGAALVGGAFILTGRSRRR